MKIATWNLERPITKNQKVLDKLVNLNADVLILTETNSVINPAINYFLLESEPLFAGYDGVKYQAGENRTTIWTKYKIKRSLTTSDPFTSVCGEVEAPFGMLTVY